MGQDISNKIENIQKNFIELNNMFELSIIANQATDLSDFIDKVSDFIHLSLGVEDVLFFLPEGQIFTVVNGSTFMELSDNNDGFWKLLQEGELIRFVSSTGETLYKSFIESNGLKKIDTHYLRGFNKDGILIGICSIGSKAGDVHLTDDECVYLNKILSYVEPILYKFIKRDNQQKDMKRIYKTLHNVSILYNISQAMNFIDDLKRLLNIILDKALETIYAEKGSLMLYDFAENVLQVKVVYGLPDKKVEDDINSGVIECAKIRAGEGIAGMVFANKKSVISNLGQNDPRFKDFASSTTNVNSLLCVPLIAKGEAIGVVNITNKKNNQLFNKQDLEFMEALANQAAIAIDNAKLYELATKDGLTKLYTHRHFFTMLDTELKRAQRYNHVLSVLMMDIDDFKQVNDTYGHAAGDKVLREVAAIIGKTVRKIDMPARYGGEEFAVILPETKGQEAVVIAHRLRNRIQNLEITLNDGTLLKITVSVGIASFPDAGQDELTIMEFADKALYESKKKGKNCVHLYMEEKYTLIPFEDKYA